ncbi:hypothetical protein L8C07_17740 [Paenibacillus sp. CMAA1739]|uniref:hypothetical protein n=1 Tax=Paenibacillus ottowii TaxID=2315729 RepID=UPI00272F9811|nr:MULTISPECIES: hypothetical protein [Paenibacillus]MDP1511496.1 hypothetical protein [Paenibacillus ottowii]MEC4567794.1 hypothetical protein [Paenibacillus sp. CMAA1739]
MLLKYTVQNKAEAGTYALPFQVTEQESVLSTLIIPASEAEGHIAIEVSMVWENPLLNWDIGELDIRLRRNDQQGPVLDWLQDSCYQEGYAELSYEETGTQAEPHVYCLTVQSADRRAVITGPIMIRGSVYVDRMDDSPDVQ